MNTPQPSLEEAVENIQQRIALADWRTEVVVSIATLRAALDGISTLSSRVAELEEAARLSLQEGWRPIDTAPKDGTAIDVWRAENGRDTVYWGYPHHECGEMGSYCDSDWHSIKRPGWVCATFGEFIGSKHNPFTHWKPMDPGPALPPQEEPAK